MTSEHEAAGQVVVGIPARMGSTRFPGKPLCSILGVAMVEHVWRRCLLSKAVSRVFVAVCDEQLKDWGDAVGAEVVMTNPEIESPGLRVAEAASILRIPDDDIVAIVQGDEPLIHPESIALGARPMIEDPGLFCANFCAPATDEEMADPDDVKVVTDLNRNLMYLSRSQVPWQGVGMKQLGVFFLRMKNLLEFQRLTQTPLERTESIELIRALQHGKRVRMVDYPHVVKSVDNERQRMEVESLMAEDEVWPLYREECHAAN